MAIISRQIGWSQESNLLWQILKQLNRLTSIMFGLKPKYKVYTALLTQSGGDDLQILDSGTLTIGVTYQIKDSGEGFDFTNVGAPNNDYLTFFVATGTTPANWGDSGQLYYNTGAPVVTVLENTIGNIWFEYLGVGNYSINGTRLFTENKTTVSIDNITEFQSIRATATYYIQDVSTIYLSTLRDGDPDNECLVQNRLEIRVYN